MKRRNRYTYSNTRVYWPVEVVGSCLLQASCTIGETRYSFAMYADPPLAEWDGPVPEWFKRKARRVLKKQERELFGQTAV